MRYFVNIITHTDDYLQEYLKAWMRQFQLTNYRIVMCIAEGIVGVALMATGDDPSIRMLGLIILLPAVLLPYSWISRPKRAIKLQKERYAVSGINRNIPVREVIDLQEGTISSQVEGKEERLTIPLGATVNYFESENYFYIVTKGSLSFGFDKNGFREGTPEDFRSFMHTLPKKKNRRHTLINVLLAVVVLSGLSLLFS